MYHPKMNKIQTFNSDYLGFAANRWFPNEQDPVVKADLIRELNQKMYTMLE
jgi:hypothetical protein